MMYALVIFLLKGWNGELCNPIVSCQSALTEVNFLPGCNCPPITRPDCHLGWLSPWRVTMTTPTRQAWFILMPVTLRREYIDTGTPAQNEAQIFTQDEHKDSAVDNWPGVAMRQTGPCLSPAHLHWSMVGDWGSEEKVGWQGEGGSGPGDKGTAREGRGGGTQSPTVESITPSSSLPYPVDCGVRDREIVGWQLLSALSEWYWRLKAGVLLMLRNRLLRQPSH